jgi:hypothetical protein
MGDLGEIIRAAGEEYLRRRATTPFQRKAMAAIAKCRTPAMGGERARCDGCGAEHMLFRSCRNRHCPRCQSAARAEWLAARERELLPVPYFHVVFTVPEDFHPLALHCPEVFYASLFRAAGQALLDVGMSKLGAMLGALCVLHTWGQALTLHPHIHMVVPGGGFSPDRRRWIHVRKSSFLLPVNVLSARFRTLLCDGLRKAFASNRMKRLPPTVASDAVTFDLLLARACRTRWVVYAKPPFGGPREVLQYLAAYTHRTAISNRRIVSFDGKEVSFSWRDYADHSAQKVMTLPVTEFLRRFLLHVLPTRLVRIRYVGFLGNHNRRRNLEHARSMLGVSPPAEPVEERTDESRRCPDCRTGTLRPVSRIEPSGFQWSRPPPLPLSAVPL